MEETVQLTKYEQRNITDSVERYFFSLEDFDDFCETVRKNFKELEEIKAPDTDVCFCIDSSSYSEYGETYTDISFLFEYQIPLTKEDIEQEMKEKQINADKDKVFNELIGKLSTNSIGSIMQNDDLREMYLNGVLKFDF